MTTRPFVFTVISCLLAFAAGIVTAASWNQPVRPAIPAAPAYVPTPTPTPTPEPETAKQEAVFGKGRLTIVPEEMHFLSDRLHYNINVRYPQIVGSDDLHIRNLNWRMRRFAINHYQWALRPSKAELQRFKSEPEPYNLVEVSYDIMLATDSILSINFFTDDYYIGAAHSATRSYVINYDLKSHRELKLTDLFKPNSGYLDFIARYCTADLRASEPLTPKAATFANWNLVEDGILFNFDACSIMGCSAGSHSVSIPFSALVPFLKPSQVK